MYFRLEVKTDRGWEGVWTGLWYLLTEEDGEDVSWADSVWCSPDFRYANQKLDPVSLPFQSQALSWFTKDGWFELGMRIESALRQFAPAGRYRLRTRETADESRPKFRDFYQVAI